jgi:hypothetical protein
MAAGLPQTNVTKQYRQDLRERWMFNADPVERHRRFRSFFGKLAEIQCAEWLESQGWTISGLEALRQGPDIEAYTGNHRPTAFEVKFFGTENDDFALMLGSLAGHPAVRTVSPYVAANYLLFKAYDAATQFKGKSCGRIAVLIIDESTWWRFEVQLRNNWLDWTDPRFLRDNSGEWERFLAEKIAKCPAKYSTITADLRPVLHWLDAVWILKRSAGYQYHREFEIPK